MRVLLYPRVLSARATNTPIYASLATALRERGLDVTLAVTRWDGSAEEAVEHGVVVVPARPRWETPARALSPLLRGRQPVRAAAALTPWLRQRRDRFDVLHAEDVYPGGLALALAARIAGVAAAALVLKPMGEDVLSHGPSRYGFRRHALPRALIGRTLRRADGVRVTSPVVDEALADLRVDGVRREIPVSVSAATVARARRDAEERARSRRRARAEIDDRHGTGGRPLVLALGRLHPFKGLDVLVRALAAVPDAHLLLVGPSLRVPGLGDVGAGLRALAHDVGVGDRVRLVPRVDADEAHRYLAAADVVAVPSHVESHNKVCIEAAAAGTPFVVTGTTGVAARVPEAGVGLVVPPGSPEALAQTLRRVLDGDWRHDPAAAATFVERFAPERIAARLADLYRQAVSVAARRASDGPPADRR